MCRRGGCQALCRAGWPTYIIKSWARWDSNMVELYAAEAPLVHGPQLASSLIRPVGQDGSSSAIGTTSRANFTAPVQHGGPDDFNSNIEELDDALDTEFACTSLEQASGCDNLGVIAHDMDDDSEAVEHARSTFQAVAVQVSL